MVSNDVIEGVELSPYCGERYRYVRYYNDSIHSLDGYGDNEFRLFRALLYYTDVDSLCVDLRGSWGRFRIIEMAYRGIDSVDGNIRRYQGSMRILLRHRLVLDSRGVTGFKGVMVNPYVAFAGDFHDRKRAIRVWKKLFVGKV